MKLLFDTHTFMWWHSEPDRIPRDTLTLLQNPNHEGSTVPLMIKHPFNISKTIGVHGFNLN
ncbi:MAG: hypothetical protein AN490_15050 [Anabaena sp. AL09]|jgi:PIN domain nuclease of toxin-antitoxin system|nr:MAG: hypothetical protein AN490_15050 [Anabaena sp. AL09]